MFDPFDAALNNNGALAVRWKVALPNALRRFINFKPAQFTIPSSSCEMMVVLVCAGAEIRHDRAERSANHRMPFSLRSLGPDGSHLRNNFATMSFSSANSKGTNKDLINFYNFWFRWCLWSPRRQRDNGWIASFFVDCFTSMVFDIWWRRRFKDSSDFLVIVLQSGVKTSVNACVGTSAFFLRQNGSCPIHMLACAKIS